METSKQSSYDETHEKTTTAFDLSVSVNQLTKCYVGRRLTRLAIYFEHDLERIEKSKLQ